METTMFNPFMICESSVEPEFDIFDPPIVPEHTLITEDEEMAYMVESYHGAYYNA
jgi:hypothetical protein